jgi:uncharacterized oligopeptide transporter (OPT) family protein
MEPTVPAEVTPSTPDSTRIGPIEATVSVEDALEADEATWYDSIYRGPDSPQLTLRAVLMGSGIGFVLAFTNLYVGLKTGWHFGVSITACLLSFVLWSGLQRTGLVRTPLSILENNCMQTTASSAGLATGGELVSAIAALLMLSATVDNPGGKHLPWPILTLWMACVALLGVSFAVPMKRNLINRERLRFPSGVACAATLQSLYASSADAFRKGRALLVAALASAIVPLLVELRAFRGPQEESTTLLPGFLPIFDGWLPVRGVDRDSSLAFTPSSWNMVLELNPIMVAGGMLIGLRIAAWVLFGSLITIYLTGPMGLEAAFVTEGGSTIWATTHASIAWREMGLWLGAPLIVASGLTSIAVRWKAILRAFSRSSEVGPLEARIRATEVPGSWFLAGVAVAGTGLVLLGWRRFEIPILLGVLAVALSYAIGLVAARVTGEADITPTGALGKVTQLSYGVLIPQSVPANLMTACITAGSAASTADLLNDMKSGYLLGAKPRSQFLAQVAGIVAGTVATVTGFYALVPDATVLMDSAAGGPIYPAPAARIWLAVAEIFRDGLENMHPVHRTAIGVGAGIGTLLGLAEHFFPRWKQHLPSASGFGLGLFLPFPIAFSVFIGATIATVWQRKWSASLMIPIASGCIAGISVAGVLVACVNNMAL